MSKALVCLNHIHRIQDNPLLTYCAENKLEAVPFLIYKEEQINSLGAAEKLWLSHSIEDLNKSLDSKLILLKNEKEIEALIDKEDISHFIYSFNAESRINIDYEELENDFQEIEFVKLQANNIFDFDEIRNKSGKVFRVFTPFYKHCLTQVKRFISDNLKKDLVCFSFS